MTIEEGRDLVDSEIRRLRELDASTAESIAASRENQAQIGALRQQLSLLQDEHVRLAGEIQQQEFFQRTKSVKLEEQYEWYVGMTNLLTRLSGISVRLDYEHNQMLFTFIAIGDSPEVTLRLILTSQKQLASAKVSGTRKCPFEFYITFYGSNTKYYC